MATVTTGSSDLTAAFDTIFDYVTVLRAESIGAYQAAMDVEARGDDPAAFFEHARIVRARYRDVVRMAHDLEGLILESLPHHD